MSRWREWFDAGRYLRNLRGWGASADDLHISYEDPARHGYLRPHPAAPRHLDIRPVLGRDHHRVESCRLEDRDWLAPWESGLPPAVVETLPTMSTYIRRCDRAARQGTALQMMIEADGEVVGTVSVSNVQRGALYSASIGYWVHSSIARLGIGSLAVASVIDLVLTDLGLHRVEVNIRPENAASLGLARALGLREEGVRSRYMFINGSWCDHVSFAIDRESLPPGGLIEVVRARRRGQGR